MVCSRNMIHYMSHLLLLKAMMGDNLNDTCTCTFHQQLYYTTGPSHHSLTRKDTVGRLEKIVNIITCLKPSL